MDFDEVLDEAEAEPADTRTVRVCVKPTVAKKRAALLEQLEKAKEADKKKDAGDQRLGASETPTSERTDAAVAELESLDEQVSKSLVTLKFTQIMGDRWSALTFAHPMRVDVPLDMQYGYNFDAVSRKAAVLSGVRVDDDGEHALSELQWARLFKILSGPDYTRIIDTVWTLNEYVPARHIESLVKGFGAA